MSPHRSFRDDADQEWTAWDVVPSWAERRVADRGPVGAAGEPPPNQPLVERRHVNSIRVALSPELMDGWLAFESDDARRRLTPIPADWHLLSDEELRTLWKAAEEMPQRRRRLVE